MLRVTLGKVWNQQRSKTGNTERGDASQSDQHHGIDAKANVRIGIGVQKKRCCDGDESKQHGESDRAIERNGTPGEAARDASLRKLDRAQDIAGDECDEALADEKP